MFSMNTLLSFLSSTRILVIGVANILFLLYFIAFLYYTQLMLEWNLID